MNNITRNAARIVTTALLATASIAAFAQSNSEMAARDQANSVARNNYPVVIFHSTESRAAVNADLAAAQPGTMSRNTNGNFQIASQSSNKSNSGSGSNNASLYQGA